MPITIDGSGTITGLSAGGLPDGVITQAELASDVAVVPVGTVIHVARDTAPTGWVKANGAAISRTTYAALFSAIGTTYGTGDGSTTFNLPDLRGEFIRGWDDGRGADSGRSFGTAQAAQTQQYKSVLVETNAAGIYNGGPFNGETWNRSVNSSTNTMRRIDQTYQTNLETRPRNVALLACIKF